MNRLNRRRFLALGAASTASVVLVACGNESPADADLTPTQIPDVAGAPPTLAPITSTPQSGGGEAGGGEEQAGGEGGGGTQTEAIVIKAMDSLAFDPSELEVAPGQTLTLQNDGFLQHDLAVDDWGGQLTPLLNNGETAEFTIPEDAAVGESFEYYCTVPGHKEGGMVGTFTIVEAGAAAAPAEEEATEGEEEGAAEEGAAAGGTGEAITIIALDTLAFDPAELEVAPGQALTLQNDGFLQHDLAVDDWGGQLTPLLNNGETAEFTIPEDAAVGESFEFYCTVPGHKEGGMVGTFTIVEGGGAAAGGEEEAPAEEASAEEEDAPAAAAADEGAGGGGEAITIIALDTLAFDPAELEVSPGQTLTLQNDGFLQHDLAVDDWGGALTPMLNNGETAEFAIPEDAAVGEQFEYYCTVPGHKEGGMVGTFTIVEGGGETAAAPAGGGEEEASDEEAATAEASPEAAASTDDIVVDGVDPSEAAVQVVATEWQFEPADFEIAPGETIALVNRGTVAHGMSAEAFGGTFIDPVGAGHSDSFTIPEDIEVGEVIEYTATNESAANLGMGGTITIVEASASATPAASPEAAPAGGGGSDAEPITIIALDTLSFDPSEVDVAPGQTVILQNDGFLQHDLAVDDWGGALTPMLNNGETAEFTIPEDAAVGEEFEFYCTVPGHYEGGMVGTFTIIEG